MDIPAPIAYAILFAIIVMAIAVCTRMVITHRRDMRALDVKHAQWQATTERKHKVIENAVGLIREGFNPRGKVLEIGPDYIVAKGQDGKPITTMTR